MRALDLLLGAVISLLIAWAFDAWTLHAARRKQARRDALIRRGPLMSIPTPREVLWLNREFYVAWSLLWWCLINCFGWLVWCPEPGFAPSALWLENLRWCQWLLLPSLAACVPLHRLGVRRTNAFLARLRAAEGW